MIRKFISEGNLFAKDLMYLKVVVNEKGNVFVEGIDAYWIDGWIADMKRIQKLAPSTIRARIGALARCTDWAMRKKILVMPDHPLRTLPNGYAQYNETDAALAGTKREDIEQDRRLEPGEWERIITESTSIF